MTLPFRWGVGEGGELRLIVEGPREDLQQCLERREIVMFHCSTQRFLGSMVAWNKCRVRTSHGLRALQRFHRFAREPRAPMFTPSIVVRRIGKEGSDPFMLA